MTNEIEREERQRRIELIVANYPEMRSTGEFVATFSPAEQDRIFISRLVEQGTNSAVAAAQLQAIREAYQALALRRGDTDVLSEMFVVECLMQFLNFALVQPRFDEHSQGEVT